MCNCYFWSLLQAGAHTLGSWLTKCLLRHWKRSAHICPVTSQHAAAKLHSSSLHSGELSCLPTSRQLASAYSTRPTHTHAAPTQENHTCEHQAVYCPWFATISSYHLCSSIKWVNEGQFESIYQNYHSEEFMYTFIHKCVKWLTYNST